MCSLTTYLEKKTKPVKSFPSLEFIYKEQLTGINSLSIKTKQNKTAWKNFNFQGTVNLVSVYRQSDKAGRVIVLNKKSL